MVYPRRLDEIEGNTGDNQADACHFLRADLTAQLTHQNIEYNADQTRVGVPGQHNARIHSKVRCRRRRRYIVSIRTESDEKPEHRHTEDDNSPSGFTKSSHFYFIIVHNFYLLTYYLCAGFPGRHRVLCMETGVTRKQRFRIFCLLPPSPFHSMY